MLCIVMKLQASQKFREYSSFVRGSKYAGPFGQQYIISNSKQALKRNYKALQLVYDDWQGTTEKFIVLDGYSQGRETNTNF